MNKDDYIKQNNIQTRTVSPSDIAAARTDYQRNADYIINVNGEEYYSNNVSLHSMQLCVAMCHQRFGYMAVSA